VCISKNLLAQEPDRSNPANMTASHNYGWRRWRGGWRWGALDHACCILVSIAERFGSIAVDRVACSGIARNMALEEARIVRVKAVRTWVHTTRLKVASANQVCIDKGRRLRGPKDTRLHRRGCCKWILCPCREEGRDGDLRLRSATVHPNGSDNVVLFCIDGCLADADPTHAMAEYANLVKSCVGERWVQRPVFAASVDYTGDVDLPIAAEIGAALRRDNDEAMGCDVEQQLRVLRFEFATSRGGAVPKAEEWVAVGCVGGVCDESEL